MFSAPAHRTPPPKGQSWVAHAAYFSSIQLSHPRTAAPPGLTPFLPGQEERGEALSGSQLTLGYDLEKLLCVASKPISIFPLILLTCVRFWAGCVLIISLSLPHSHMLCVLTLDPFHRRRN